MAARLIWGSTQRYLVGDFLFGRAFELMVESGSLQALKILARLLGIAEGEVMQLTPAHDLDRPRTVYLQMIQAKTAELFAAAAAVGAVVADRPDVRGSAPTA